MNLTKVLPRSILCQDGRNKYDVPEVDCQIVFILFYFFIIFDEI